ncbi:hypothetical protein GFH48_12790 [Streptomyces fagopyri]|uniref:Uncharacterized protein n=1 Tax=Streptomyces fagopyri TaxID=2662397 RepID=A0A5Q0LB97_9ACTN|nr:hypothetical protein [Streptomyces fagopyri]QFZ74006.1 hypothetical protein GFH48_12790 [Streptomyces fagopyri]
MKIATGNIINMAPAQSGWTVNFHHGEPETVTCPVIGWATVVEGIVGDGVALTSVKAAFVYLDTVWTADELREHDHEVSAVLLNAPASTPAHALV